jgi:DNA replication and repair protein RecF
MILNNLKILNFNNYSEENVAFCNGINCLTGPNGSGKTNLLDAIYLLALTKSAFNKTDAQNVKHTEAFFSVSGNYSLEQDNFQLQCSFKAGEKKMVRLNQVPYTRLSDHIGKFPVVLATPDDTNMIREGGEERRKFFDGILAQTDHDYLEHLIKYNAYLQQRNSLLKTALETRRLDTTLLDTYDSRLIPHANALHARRSTFVAFFEPVFNRHYAHLSNHAEEVSLQYNSLQHSDSYAQLLKNARSTDLVYGRTTVGPHKDDFVFNLGNHPMKKFGSQGQQKCFVIALKLAQYHAMLELNGQKPTLLLDDIFDKLDDNRIANLLNTLQSSTFGQIFITDARPERSLSLLGALQKETRFFKVFKGTIQVI